MKNQRPLKFSDNVFSHLSRFISFLIPPQLNNSWIKTKVSFQILFEKRLSTSMPIHIWYRSFWIKLNYCLIIYRLTFYYKSICRCPKIQCIFGLWYWILIFLIIKKFAKLESISTITANCWRKKWYFDEEAAMKFQRSIIKENKLFDFDNYD